MWTPPVEVQFFRNNFFCGNFFLQKSWDSHQLRLGIRPPARLGGGGGGGGSDEPGSPGRRLSLMLSPSAPSLGADGRPRSESAARRAIRRVSGMFTSGAGPQRSDSVSDDGGPPCFPGFDPMAPEASRRRGREVSSVFAVEPKTTRFEPRPSHPRRAPRGTRRRRAHRRRGCGGWWWWLAVRSSVLIYLLSPAMGSRSRVA